MKTMLRSACLGIFLLATAGGLWGAATNRFAATNGPGEWPYTNWATAGTNIIDVVNVANANNAGDTVFVSNGIYYLTNQIVISNAVVTNFSGIRANVVINGNYPNTTNRCFYVNSPGARIYGFTITNGYAKNTVNVGRGAGVYFANAGIIKDCLVTGNRSEVSNTFSSGGGGIFLQYATADSCSVIGNIIDASLAGATHWNGGGGGIAVNYNGLITNCYVAYNVATNNMMGGGIAILENAGRVENCTIIGNNAGNADGHGYGGIYVRPSAGGYMTIRNCSIISNRSVGGGGGMGANADTSTTLVYNCLIAYNRSVASGAGICLYNSSRRIPINIESCTIVSNIIEGASSSGGGIYFRYTSPTYGPYISNVWNCIIYDNYANSGTNLYDYNQGSNQTAVVYSCTAPGSGFDIAGVVTSSPAFVNAANGNYCLSPNSPCVNAGTNRDWMILPGGTVDLDGRTRIRYGTVDMGAYERINEGTFYNFR